MKEGLKAALNEELKPLEQEIQSITKQICLKNAEKMTEYFRDISIAETIELLHKIYKVNENMKQTIQSQITDNRKSRMILPKNTPNRIIIQLHHLYSFSKLLSKAWSRRPINGHFEYAFQVIKDEIKSNVSKVVEKLVEEDKCRIIRKLKHSGMNLNPNNSVYNFEIAQRSNTEVARSRIEEHTRSSVSMTTVAGILSTTTFNDTMTISFNAGLGSNDLGSQIKEKQDYETGKHLVEEILHMKTSASSSGYTKTNRNQFKKTEGVFDGEVVNWNDTSEDETQFVNKFYTCLLYTSPSPRDRG